MNEEKIIVIARIKVKDDAVEEAKQLVLAVAENSRAEAGNINYDIHQAVDDPTVFMWHETWANKTAIEGHFQEPFFKEFYAKAEKLIAEPPQITQTKMITEKV